MNNIKAKAKEEAQAFIEAAIDCYYITMEMTAALQRAIIRGLTKPFKK